MPHKAAAWAYEVVEGIEISSGTAREGRAVASTARIMVAIVRKLHMDYYSYGS